MKGPGGFQGFKRFKGFKGFKGFATFGLCVMLAAAAIDLRAQAQPTFRSSVEYVEVDVVVTNQQGEFVRDLTKDDFELSEDGRRQPVANFSLVDIPVEKYTRPLFASQPVEPDVRTNEHPFEGRIYVMVMDDLHTDPLRLQRTKAAARQFIERLGANDLMAVAHTAGADSASQEFTNSKRLLLAAVDKTMGRALESSTEVRNRNAIASAGNTTDDTQDLERAMNAENTLRLLRDISTWFATVRGRRKSILFVSEGIDYDITNVMERSDQPGTRASTVMDATREAIDAAMRSNVSIYGIDPRGVTGIDDIGIEYANGPNDPAMGQRALASQQRLEADSLRMLAEETGGAAVVGRNDLVKAYDRIVADNSSYYVLAYTSPSEKRDGKFHRIDVRVNRPGLVARARRGYMAPKGKAPAAPLPAAGGPSAGVRDVLANPLPVSGLTMSVSMAPFKGTAPNASVLVTAELRGRDLNLVPNDTLEFSYVAVDAKGKVRAGSNDRIKVTALRPETKGKIEQSGLRVFNRVELAPGRYQIRLATHDEGGGAVGSVAYDLDVPDFYKLPFSMSGLIMTSLSTGSMVVVKADDQLKDLLPAPPVVERSFPQGDEIALFAEVYDNEARSPHKVDMETRLTSDAGNVVFKIDEARDSTEIGGARGGYGYTARVPLTDLAPGLYVLTVEAKSRLGRDAAASRQVQITVTKK
jgi:VWFA-related protein